MRNSILILVVTLLGSWVLWTGTDGLHAFTSEGARRYAVEKQPLNLPQVIMRDQDGNRFSLSSLRGKYVLFTFFYTRCDDLCPLLETQFEKMIAAIPESYKGKDITFLSISFDPAHDDRMALADYAKAFLADGISWRVATIPDNAQLQALLKLCGVVVIPDNAGGYEHNAAIYAADRQLRLTHIFDYNNTNLVVKKIISLLEV